MTLIEKIARGLAYDDNGSHVNDYRISQAKAAIHAIQKSGYVIVPKEPTEEMKVAGGMIPDAFTGTVAAQGNAKTVYKCMIAVAPNPLEAEQ